VNQDTAIALAKVAGFEFVASSEINANPKDTRDHSEDVCGRCRPPSRSAR